MGFPGVMGKGVSELLRLRAGLDTGQKGGAPAGVCPRPVLYQLHPVGQTRPLQKLL